MERFFFELLQVAIGNKPCLSAVPTNEEWMLLFQMCQKQALVGIAFHGVQLLPKEQRPERSLIIQWYAVAMQIEQRNALTTEVCHLLVKDLDADGLGTCILKGQANHQYYDGELAPLRTCGDVDVWVAPKDKGEKQPVRKVIEYFSAKGVMESLCYLHIEITPVKDVPVEVHLRPSFMNEPFCNRRFQQLFGHGGECWNRCTCMEKIDGVVLPVLTVDYDAIFQLNHIYRHLIDEGVGLRQVLDYYMLLKTWKDWHKMQKESIQQIVRGLGMARFASALMYVLKEVFAMPEEWMICEASEKAGRFLLDEILQSGNFGHYDSRMTQLEVRKGETSYQIQRAWRRFVRNLHFLTSYPEEVIWEPVARVEHLWWRKWKLWRW